MNFNQKISNNESASLNRSNRNPLAEGTDRLVEGLSQIQNEKTFKNDTPTKILFFGSTGWIGSFILKTFNEKKNFSNDNFIFPKVRLDNFSQLSKYLESLDQNLKISSIILAAGLTGRPNVDWCEDHRDEVLSTNVIGPSILAKWAYHRKIHLTYLGTGCIYEYDNKHTIEKAIKTDYGFTEGDRPNFDESFYSSTKTITESILKEYQALILRIRMPLSDDLHSRNFITKITKYQKVVNVPNSMTVLHDLIPLIPEMMDRKLIGVYNFTNPGVISHNEILNLYTKYIDQNFKYTNFSLEEQAKILKAGRSNNCLDSSKLLKEFPEIPHISDSIIRLFERMRENLKNSN